MDSVDRSLPPSLIDLATLVPLLGEAHGRFDVEMLPECASTNSELCARAAAGAPSGTVIVADRQTAGRGSRGRSWYASPEASLTFSLLWKFGGGLERLSGLSLAVGVAIVRALERCGAEGVTLKWPNDILHDGAKLGGILIELESGVGGAAQAVIGIGLNLRPPETIGPPLAAALPPTALDRLIPLPARELILAALLIELLRVFDAFAAGGFAALRDDWQARHAWQGRMVCLLRDGILEKEGVCLGADADGALLVDTGLGIERCLSGDVSLRMRP